MAIVFGQIIASLVFDKGYSYVEQTRDQSQYEFAIIFTRVSTLVLCINKTCFIKFHPPENIRGQLLFNREGY